MNRTILLGRLTADPELKTTPQGTSVTRFTIAVDRRIKTENGPQADFITCVAWRGTADFICKHFHKGKMIAIEGRLQSRSWDGQDGKRQYATEVLIDNAYFAGDKATNNVPPNHPDYIPSGDTQNTPSYDFADMGDVGDDDLPF